MNRWVGKIAIVTGASSGIGLSIAKTFIKEGLIVVGLARRKEKMEAEIGNLGKTCKGKFYPIKCDVSSEDDVKQAFEWIKKNIGVVQILINNAGLGVIGNFADMDLAVSKNILNVNLFGTINCTKEALTVMKESKVEGHIININSIQGHRVYCFGELGFNTYPASKHAITGFTETLQRELIGQKIRVTSISPGYVSTEIAEANNFGEHVTNLPCLESQDIADAIFYVISTPPRVQITELTIRPLGETLL
ncbi:hypothetical protein HCN44_008226 [Aphidius gifuensis]|uniref:Uncharacterized protein n=1 Tax=Aphidius gifuensis TaxID=684658 RepID=A0A835CMS0_APHGI|nr:farnesol dehydrogenase-like [Aphidius gifuensis]KAF7989552.1 hypothetical protein HCN44_008226 [Aphidius gifuensis]